MSNLQRSRLIVGVLLIGVAALLFVFGAGNFSTQASSPSVQWV